VCETTPPCSLAGPLIGPVFGLEGHAFFLEAIFLGDRSGSTPVADGRAHRAGPLLRRPAGHDLLLCPAAAECEA
jgi:hypothetical protein